MQLDFVAAGADSAEKDKTKSAKKDDKKGKKDQTGEPYSWHKLQFQEFN